MTLWSCCWSNLALGTGGKSQMLVFWLVEVVRRPPIASESPSGHWYRPTTWCFRLVELGGFVELFGAPRRRGAPCKSRQHGPG